jgi:molybdopterin molybdotransferase
VLTVDEAQARILDTVVPLGVETVSLAQAYGRFLAVDLVAGVDLPPWDNSAMDGYAVRAADTGEGDVVLALVETVGAGSVATGRVEPGTAIGIMTGAPLPAGADAVVMVEDSDGARAGVVRIRKRATPGQHVRRRGEDVRSGERVLRAGTRLGPAAVGLASSLGRTEIEVRRQPIVAVLSTGDEVVAPGTTLRAGQIWSSNNASLSGQILEAGGVPLDLGNAPDRLDDTIAALARAVEAADVVVTTGGVSVGAFDVVKEAHQALGVVAEFWKVRMKPGKPLAFGHIDSGGRSVPLFGLPGNPVSCMVNFAQFVRPWLRTALGDPRPHLPVVEAVAAESFDDAPGRARLVRVRLSRDGDRIVAHSTGSQSSGVLTSMVRAHGLMLVGVDAPPPREGERVRVQILDPSFLDGESADYGW